MQAKGGLAGRVAIGLAILAVAGTVAGYGIASRAQPEPVQVDLPAAKASPEPAAEAVVHVAGAVHAPGVYRFGEDERVEAAIAAAGGAREDADLDALNLAAKLHDGERIYVPVEGEEESAAGSPGRGSDGPGRVNVNTAGSEELQSLPGVGPAIAERILAHRETHGRFETPRDLLKVSGIGPRTLESLEDLITV